jgi:hypothetical protein
MRANPKRTGPSGEDPVLARGDARDESGDGEESDGDAASTVRATIALWAPSRVSTTMV